MYRRDRFFLRVHTFGPNLIDLNFNLAFKSWRIITNGFDKLP